MESFWQDLRHSMRMIMAKPGFAAAALLTLAIGIGANSTVFSFANGILLRPLPYRDPGRLVALDETQLKRGVTSMGVSYPNFMDWRERNQVFEHIAVYQADDYTLIGAGDPVEEPGARVSQGLFEILGVAPLLGRTFTKEEDQPNQNTVVILSQNIWQSRFGSNPAILGQSVIVGSRPHTIIGVMPAGFKFPDVAEIWTPLALNDQLWTRNDHGLSAIARLKAGVSIEQARKSMEIIAERIEQENPVTNEGLSVSVTPFREALAGDYQRAVWTLLGATGLVLLIACVNVANLLLARASARQREIAIRVALGAGRWRILRQMLTESMVLGALGGALGLLLATWGIGLLLSAIPIQIPFWMKFELDYRVVAFTSAISLFTGLIFGSAPALQAARFGVTESLKDGARGPAGSRGRFRNLLVIAEVSISVVLLIGAGLMARSFLRLEHVSAGIDPNNVLAATIHLPQAKYREDSKRIAFHQRLVEKVRALPGVQSAAEISGLPLSGSLWGRSLTAEGSPVLSVGQAPIINHCVVTPEYFRSMGIPILRGRDFTDADSSSSLKVTIIDQRLAREYWPNGNPIGQRIRFGPPEDNEPWHTIVGVVGAVRHERLDAETRKSVYLPFLQNPLRSMTLTVRSAVPPEQLVREIGNAVKDLDPSQPMAGVQTMNEVVSESIWQPRLYTGLFGFFSIAALVLASIGIYGVMSYSVAQRTHEIGIRMALGAQADDVLRLVAGHGLGLALAGIGIGLAGALALTRLLSSLLFEVSATDPMTFVAIALLLTAVAAFAGYVPARRAAKVDPMVALRYE